jgi:hypothetical protein
MLESFTFWLSVVAVLVAYLCASVGQRWRAEETRRRARERESPGTAFDVSAIAPQIRRVREDPLAVMRARRRYTHYRTELVAVARRMLSQLPFFRRESPEHEKSRSATPDSRQPSRVLLLAALACLLVGCSHLKPTADTHPPEYQDTGKPGLLDCLARTFWPGNSH